MTKKRVFVEEAEVEEYPHKAAWEVVTRQIERAKANPTGALYDDLVAMVFAFHCMEGYLNFVGGKIAPELWDDERTSFKGKGLTDKLAVISERCGISMPEKGKRPLATLRELKKLRDTMVHSKTHKFREPPVQFAKDKLPPLFRKSYLESLISHKKALRARDDVKCIADKIHSAAVSQFPCAGLGRKALEGIHSMRTTSTRLVPPSLD